MSDADRVEEPITVTDKRRIDPDTGQVRENPSEPAPSGPATDEFAGETEEEAGKAAELLADLQRVQADFSNYRRRTLRDQQVIADRAKASVITQLLPVLDDLDRARSHGDLDSGPLKAVADKIVTTLEGLGLSGFGEEGDEFDPELHEAVQHEGEGTHPVLGSVMRRGYKVGDVVVRHAMVGVVDTVPDASGSGNADSGAQQPSES
ncbi:MULTISPECIES: nucleotide exchange factor GrpE [Mycolicibacterium]|uniref:Protein GrpE n=3 Tax=Mycolicibacterium gilvum TaxID=1804 RepID=E6TNQ9_MYCSR|nr:MULTISPECIES: nucleotide exchange factor GrpE [Mycolicibacterium]ABP42753.1 GrpE protein [Mycolicibacterium gilvum PYR-GCK]ADT97226.1 molecular chaperone GrpE (heat shock protein) [Mycolicibacterium gilvum Spyr1]MBV5245246.1 nucleotide exchange factor GrpE [Mycolicibacterium sp. PAM1]MCV7055926.1 nucleotide exchange factor GrpE [Mycolicibacterium gilvum]STZ41331.1 GrpE protein HSP-70 cofactor [Mycolicibacterium gilvum]